MVAILIILASILNIINCQREGEPCVNKYTNTAGTCVPTEQCRSAILDMKNNGIQPTFCEYEAFQPSIVCCRDGSSILQTVVPNKPDDRPVWGTSSSSDKKRISERKCEEYSQNVVEITSYFPLLPNAETMSITSAKCAYAGVGLVVGGENAKQGEFPHMAAIGWTRPEGGYRFDCGGSLISPRFVLTAAHCTQFNREEPSIVRLGDQNIDSTISDGANPIDVSIKRMISHPKYFSPLKYYDIALFELDSDVKFTKDIRPACLWTKDDFAEHKKALATGWGVTDPQTGETSKELQKVSLSLLKNDYCNELLFDTRNRNWPEGFIPSQMCAGELRGGKDTCQGDSGSPLQVSSKDNHCIYYIIGLTSFGKDCAKQGVPGVYTRVSSFVDWIEGIVWPGE